MAFSLSAQNIPDGSNIIIITTKDKTESTFRNFARILVKEGFVLETTEPILLILTTKIKDRSYGFLGGGTVRIKLSAQVDQMDSASQITLTGIFDDPGISKAMGIKSDMFDKDAIVISSGSSSSSSKGAAWKIMDEVAKKYKDAIIKYDEKK
jgi:hypothetical protein